MFINEKLNLVLFRQASKKLSILSSKKKSTLVNGQLARLLKKPIPRNPL